jgi:hypothetical protein
MISELQTLVVSVRSLKRCCQRRWPLPRKAEGVKAAMSEKFQQCIAPNSTTFPSEVIVVKPSSKGVNDIGEPKEQAR